MYNAIRPRMTLPGARELLLLLQEALCPNGASREPRCYVRCGPMAPINISLHGHWAMHLLECA